MRRELAKEFCDASEHQETLTSWQSQVASLLEQRRSLIKAVQDARPTSLASELSWLYSDIESHFDLSKIQIRQLLVHWQRHREPRTAKRKRLFCRASMTKAGPRISRDIMGSGQFEQSAPSPDDKTFRNAAFNDTEAESDDPNWDGSDSESSEDESESRSDADNREEELESVNTSIPVEKSDVSRKRRTEGATAQSAKRRKKGGGA